MVGAGGFPPFLDSIRGKAYDRDPIIGYATARASVSAYLSNHLDITHVALPAYTCPDFIRVFTKHQLSVSFYEVDIDLRPKPETVNAAADMLVLTNLFGVKRFSESEILSLWPSGKKIMFDNAHDLFAPSYQYGPTIYSARKFICVPDGAWIIVDGLELCLQTFSDADQVKANLESLARSSFLLEREALGPDGGYEGFRRNEEILSELRIQPMSQLSREILARIDINAERTVRQTNYNFIAANLGNLNQLSIPKAVDGTLAPLYYPLMVNEGCRIRQRLIDRHFYVPTLWDGLDEFHSIKTALYLASNLVPIPIHQGMSTSNLDSMCSTIRHWLS